MMITGLCKKTAYRRWLLGVLVMLAALILLPGAKASAQVVDSGSCGAEGDNVTWTLDDQGTVTISGTGAMKDYSTYVYGLSPFHQSEAVRQVVIEGEITNIGAYLFYGCSELTHVTIEAPITGVGAFAFNVCSKLESINLPNRVEHIDNYAFWKCASLSGTLTLPTGLKTLGKGAFYQSAYDTVVFPAGLTGIGESAFSGCKSLATLSFPECFDDSCPIDNSAFFGCSALKSVTLPEGVTVVDYSAFQLCSGLERISLPTSLRSIGRLAFSGCTRLTRLIIPAGVESVAYRAFSNLSSLSLFILGENTTLDEEIFSSSLEFTGIIYCVRGSGAEALALNKGYNIRYIAPNLTPAIVEQGVTSYAFLTLPLGKRQEMTARYSGTAQNVVFTWQSTDTRVLTVETSAEDSTVCVVEAVGLGTAHILLTNSHDADLTDMEITVYTPVTDFALSAAVWLYPQDSAQLEVTGVLPEGAGNEIPWSWRSSDESVATVDQNGVVTGHTPGDATIYARYGETERSTAAHVHANLDEIDFAFEAMAIKQGRKTQLFSDLPWLGEHSVNRLVVFSSADPTVAAVDQLGWVTGVGRGITTVRVAAFNNPAVFAECTVVVLSPNPQKLTLPQSVESIEAEAFAGIGGAEIAEIPDGCGAIGGNAFAGCESLLVVSLPGELDIAQSAFDGCGQWVFICPQGEERQSQAAAYAAGKGMRSFEEIVWISDADSVPADSGPEG